MKPLAAACLLLITAAPVWAGNWKIETAKAQQIEATELQEMRFEGQFQQWIFFAVRLPELPGQTRVNSSLEPKGTPVFDTGPAKRPIMKVVVPYATATKGSRFAIQALHYATLMERHLVEADAPAKPEPTLKPADKQAALYASTVFDFRTTAFKEWLRKNSLTRAAGEGEVELARRVFQAIAKNYTYGYEAENFTFSPSKQPKFDQWQASTVCGKDKASSAGLAVLFASAMRANQIPARILVGRWVDPKAAADGKYPVGYHVKAEFFAAHVGWVPVDLGSALRPPAKEKEPADSPADKAKEQMKFFGHDPGDFVVYHVDTEMALAPYPPIPVLHVVGSLPAGTNTAQLGELMKTVKFELTIKAVGTADPKP